MKLYVVEIWRISKQALEWISYSLRQHKIVGITEEQIKLKVLPFSLAENAKKWLYYVSSFTITVWNKMKKLSLEKYFLASKATLIRK